VAIHCAIVSQIMLFFTYANDVYTLASSSLLVTLKPVLLLRGHTHTLTPLIGLYIVLLCSSLVYTVEDKLWLIAMDVALIAVINENP